MKWLTRISGVIFALCLFLILLISAADYSIYYRPQFYEKTYAKYGVEEYAQMEMSEILKNGGYMLICAFGSLIAAFITGYLVSYITSKFSLKTRKRIFDKVESLSASEIKDFSTKRIKSGRWGGEEFVMIAPSSVEYAAFCNRLEKIRKKVEATKFKSEDGRKIKVTISIGAARLNDDLTVDEAISNADKNLYVAKKTGRNKLVK